MRCIRWVKIDLPNRSDDDDCDSITTNETREQRRFGMGHNIQIVDGATLDSEPLISKDLSRRYTNSPSVTKHSGWPGVLLPSLRNCFKSSMLRSYPVKCNMVYWRAQAWPLLKTNRSRLIHFGSLLEYFITSPHNRCAMGAHPMGAPGWPELAASGWSALTARIVLMHLSSNEVPLYSSLAFFLVDAVMLMERWIGFVVEWTNSKYILSRNVSVDPAYR